MPYVLRPRGLRAGLTALLSAVAVFVVPAAAQAACPSTPTTKAFQAFGDSADYSLVPNGGFEAGAGGWSLSRRLGGRPATSRGQGPRRRRLQVARHRRDRHRRLADGVRRHQRIRPTASSRAARAARWGVLNLQACAGRTQSGRTNETTSSALDSNFGTAWAAVAGAEHREPCSACGTSTRTSSVQLVFDPENYGGAWAIDDVYVDPYGRG